MNYKITCAILAVRVIDLEIARLRNRKRFYKMKAQRDNARDLANLYARMLNDRGVKLDEFERIAMNDLVNRA